ncbi:hypothetical protein [Neptunitalea lumnitzerae]|uniref:DUF1294 domain-containing protein n=1 Tax=Neptunitalea lumnitzerae TaxID=2965509 RepID=A0ABQ5MH35_9FLAO|nr:hypothetical protein [Neptunitalea sp. Y10]GLB48699.1 hypothetical protein Y10_10670 [Neptunitalea sp. Y10]
MIKKEVFIGFIVGIIANVFGVLLYCLVVYAIYHTGIEETITRSRSQGNLSKVIALGAVVNVLAFFGFLKIKRDYRARGVILATIFMTLLTFIEHYIL